MLATFLSGALCAAALTVVIAVGYRAYARAHAVPFDAIATQSCDWEIWTGVDGRLRWSNPSGERVSGYTAAECAAMPGFPLALVHPQDRDEIARVYHAASAGGEGNDRTFRIVRKDGAIAWVSASWQPMRDARGACAGCRASIRDITRRKTVEDTFRDIDEQFRLVIDTVKDHAIYILNAAGRVITWSDSAARITGFESHEVLGRDVAQALHADGDAADRWRALLKAAAETGWCEDEGWRQRKDKTAFWADLVLTTLRRENGDLRGFAVICRDMTDRRRVEEELRKRNQELEHLSNKLQSVNAELERLNRTDPLTGLLNRRAWEDAARQEQQRSLRTGAPYCVIMVDLDHFKRLNDTFGHQAGDECLRKVARCIGAVCREIDVAGRYGGEEFVLLAPETGPPQGVELAERVRRAIRELGLANPSSAVEPYVTASLGVAVGGDGGLDAAIREADQALYAAKREGRNRVCHGVDPVFS